MMDRKDSKKVKKFNTSGAKCFCVPLENIERVRRKGIRNRREELEVEKNREDI